MTVPVGDRLVEGYVDLLFEDAAGRLVVVDHKTDRADGDASSMPPPSATACSSRPTRSPSRRRPADPSTAPCSCSRAATAPPSSARSPTSPRPSARRERSPRPDHHRSDSHPVCCGRRPWARSSVTACSRPSGSRNSALPATNTLAPAADRAGHGARCDATVDLDVDVVAARVDHAAHLGDLRLHRGDVLLPAEAGVDGHHQHQVDEVEHVARPPSAGVAGLSATAAVAPSLARRGRACGGGARPTRRG